MTSTLRCRCHHVDSAPWSTLGIELGTRFQAFGGRRLIGATVDGLGRGSEVPPEFSRRLRTDGVEKYSTAEA
jgi:hypothetical protein